MTRSETFVAEHCENTFLSFWSFPNPDRATDGKELCDYLVVSGINVLVISVKEINITPSGNPRTDIERWQKRAIEKSFKQVYGAERAIRSKVEIVERRTRRPIIFPEVLRFWRLCIVFGRGEDFSLPSGYFDGSDGFVHFLDEISFPILVRELDTIGDLLDYLEKKQVFFDSGRRFHFSGEENLLAAFLGHNRKFPDGHDVLVLGDDLWEGFSSGLEYKEKLVAQRASYIWDKIIEEFSSAHRDKSLTGNIDHDNLELALRQLSLETRFSRRVLATEFIDLMGFFGPNDVACRIMASESGVTYVFLKESYDEDNREHRQKLLYVRCFVVRALFSKTKCVVGIASEPYVEGAGHSYDICLVEYESLTERQVEEARSIKEQLGIFGNMREVPTEYWEYEK